MINGSIRILALSSALAILSACGGPSALKTGTPNGTVLVGGDRDDIEAAEGTRTSIWDVFKNNTTENTVGVNKYLWAASLDILSFLPVQTVDPFTGVIVTGYGTPPGGGRSYRATVHISDPALDARSLNVALQSQSGPVSAATARAVEDAILSRARQLRVSDAKL